MGISTATGQKGNPLLQATPPTNLSILLKQAALGYAGKKGTCGLVLPRKYIQ